MLKKILIVALVCHVLCFCTRDNTISFPYEVDMKNALEINPSLDHCLKPMDIEQMDTLIVIGEYRDVNGFIKIYSKKSHKLLSTFGKLGQGPNEYISPASVTLDGYRKMIWFIDFPKTTFYGIKIDKFIQRKGDVVPDISFKIDQTLMPIFNYCFTNDSSVLIPTSKTSSLCTMLNFKGDTILTRGIMPEKRNNLHIISFNYFYYKFIVFNEARNRAIGAYHFFDKMLLYDFNNNSTKVLKGNDYYEYKPDVYVDGNVLNNHIGYFNCKQNGNYVFALFHGGEYHNPNMSRNYPYEIQVFDWDLNPVARLKFPCPIINFTVDENKIFILAADNENPLQVYKCDNSIIKKTVR